MLTVAWLVTDGKAAAPTEAVSVKAAESPAAMGPAWVAVTVAKAAEMLHPAPTAETKPSPEGRTSVTVAGPVVVPEPRLRATMV